MTKDRVFQISDIVNAFLENWLVEHILAGGVHGLFILGTTAEAPSLSYRLRYEVIERLDSDGEILLRLKHSVQPTGC